MSTPIYANFSFLANLPQRTGLLWQTYLCLCFWCLEKLWCCSFRCSLPLFWCFCDAPSSPLLLLITQFSGTLPADWSIFIPWWEGKLRRFCCFHFSKVAQKYYSIITHTIKKGRFIRVNCVQKSIKVLLVSFVTCKALVSFQLLWVFYWLWRC